MRTIIEETHMAQSKHKTIAAHPGEILRTEFMEPMGITAYELAKAIQTSLSGLARVLRRVKSLCNLHSCLA
jgi:addiction module HigA family antidote